MRGRKAYKPPAAAHWRFVFVCRRKTANQAGGFFYASALAECGQSLVIIMSLNLA